VTAENVAELLSDADGIIVPGGFGQRGTEGKIQALPYARENDVPLLGGWSCTAYIVPEFLQFLLLRSNTILKAHNLPLTRFKPKASYFFL